MIKVFCDRCEKKISQQEGIRLKRKLDRYEVEVMTAIDHTWNAGALCHACILEIINHGKDVKP